MTFRFAPILLNNARTGSLSRRLFTLGVGAILLLAGCVSYQSSFKIAGNEFNMPKDARFAWMQVVIPTTNGNIFLVISNGDFRMNPLIIDAKTSHDVAIIKATAEGAGQVIGEGAKAAAGVP